MGDLTGQLGYAFVVSIIDAAMVSLVVLLWYQRSVARLMRDSAALPAPRTVIAPEPSAAACPISAALFTVDASAPSRAGGADAPQWRRLVLAYCAGGALHAAIIATSLFGFEDFIVWFEQFLVYVWPLVPTLSVLLVMERGASLKLAVAFTLVGCAGVGLVTLAGQVLQASVDTSAFTSMFGFAVELVRNASVPLLVVLVSGWRRIRAVTPVALAGMLLFGLAIVVYRNVFTAAFDVESVRNALLSVPFSGDATYYGLYYGPFMVFVLPIGWAAWRVLNLLATAYERKRFSDTQMIIDCWWLIVTADQIAAPLVRSYGYLGIAIGLAAFAAYRTCVTVILSRRAASAPERPQRLLLLRVFGYQKRTETLFDRVAQRWRFTGPVQLIAGADLAMRTADPGDILAFVSGRLASRYVASTDEIPSRLAGLDVEADPDGRFRVNEVYCRDDTWRSTFQALLDTSDAVLMDIRSFCTDNAGCAYELEQLMARVPVDRISFVYDGTTDLTLLSTFLADAWQRAGHTGAPEGPIACVRVDRNSWRELRLLMQRLRGTAQPHRVLTLADLATA